MAASSSRRSKPAPASPDDDGLLDGVETNTGVFVDPSDTGTDPRGADTDGDGWSDGDEVLIGSDPNDPLAVPAIPALSPLGLGALALLLAAVLPLGVRAARR